MGDGKVSLGEVLAKVMEMGGLEVTFELEDLKLSGKIKVRFRPTGVEAPK